MKELPKKDGAVEISDGDLQIKIGLQDIEHLLSRDEYDKYMNISESLIESSDWNKSENGITIFHIVLYIIINNPKPRYDINTERLDSIKKQVATLKIMLYKKLIESKEYDYYTLAEDDLSSKTLYEATLNSILGKYAKYLTRTFSNPDKVTNETIKDTKKKYLHLKTLWCFNPLNELYIVKDFIDDIEKNEHEELLSIYNKADKINKNYARDNSNKVYKENKISRQNIDSMLKNRLMKRLMIIDISESKAKRISASVIKAIKSELLHK